MLPYASPSTDPSYPASRSAQAFFSSFALDQMKSRTSGWSILRMTIFAALRVLPPDLITPAKASKPFMKETGPLAFPPVERCSRDERNGERFVPVLWIAIIPRRSEEHTSELQSPYDLVC